LPKIEDPNLLVGFDYADDAGVYRVSDDLALIQTIDLFTPTVDDPYTFGTIVAANCLSDCYAMGGRPLTAMNIVGFSSTAYPLWIMSEMLRGGLDKLKEAGVTLCGGHTIDDLELKYGMSITGLIDPKHIATNAGAQVGDKLVLTKRIGTGILGTALKAGLVGDDVVVEMSDSMAMLNRRAAELMIELGAHACTDITGFGLIGHGAQLAKASGVGLRIAIAQVPVFAAALELVTEGSSKGLQCNRGFFADAVEFQDGIADTEQRLLFDPQTSGGLLIAIPEDGATELVRRLHEEGNTVATIIGDVSREPVGKIVVV
jgi:selenide,water dikinase